MRPQIFWFTPGAICPFAHKNIFASSYSGLSFTYNTDYSSTKGARLAAITRSGFDYSPSDPVRINVNAGRLGADKPAGFLFTFQSNGASPETLQQLDAIATGIDYVKRQYQLNDMDQIQPDRTIVRTA